ncbi:hypothetical protein SAMN06265348_108277 [Pedobacter westerhofensis]|uniref:Uncharacterized protein n=1 Tax=Pedobacter westerhofensis TaxID=425512 RepID=A0A521ELN4_9SPHI|nr:hypothetical protein [Pedobacter westerhofensis]SMO84827.1 hypothetical protein SAMN06265348_108277 [Pedobacter westerhofensis]
MALTKEERQKNKTLLLATLNYLLEYHSGDMVFDGYSPSKQWFLHDIRRTETDIKNYRTKAIQRRLEQHIMLLKYKFDLGLNQYIKDNTVYDIDIFEQFKTDVLPVISKRKIEDNDLYLVERYLKAYGANPGEQENVSLLKTLLAKREVEKSKWAELTEQITVTFSVGGKGGHRWLLSEALAPNGVFKLSVQFSGKEEYALTYVNIALPGGNGGIYIIRGYKLPIKAYWKDNHTVIIETKREYEASCAYQQITSYGEQFNIEYTFV